MSDVITTLLIQIKGDATSAVQALKDFATASTTATTQVSVAQKTMAGAGGAVNQLGQDAEAAGKHMAGMSYYFRSGMDQIRFALMGGGERAGFYAVDELVRGLVSSGMGLGTLVPIIGGVAAAIGTVVLGMHEWTAGEREAAQRAKEIGDAWKDLPKIIKQVFDMKDTGLLSPAAAENYLDYLTGKKGQLYVDENGQVTTQATHKEEQMRYRSGADLGEMEKTTPELVTVANQKATLAQAQKYFQDQATANGQVTQEQLDAAVKLKELEQQASEEALTGLEKQKAEIHDRYEKQRQEITLTAAEAGARLGDVNVGANAPAKAAQAALLNLKKAEANEIAALDANAADKAAQKKQEQAQKQQEIVDRQERALDEVRQKQQEADKQHEEDLQRQAQLTRDIQRSFLENQIEGVKANALLTDQQKLQIVTALEAKQKQINDAEISELEKLKSQVKSLSDQLELEKKIAALKHDNKQIEEKETPEQQSSFGFQFGKMFAGQQNKWTTWAQESANSFSSAWDGATNSVSGGLTHLFEYGAQKGQWFRQMWNGVIGSMISSVTKLAVDWVAQHVIMQGISMAFHTNEDALTAQSVATHAAGEATKTASTTGNSALRQAEYLAETVFHGLMVSLRVAAHLAGEVASTAITAAQAMLRAMYHAIAAAIAAMEGEASVPFVGVILGIAAGAAMMAAAYGLMGGFEKGGYTGDGHPSQIAGIVHAGEYVTPANRTTGAMNLLRAIHSGSLTDAMVPHVGAGTSTPPARTGSQGSPPVQHVTHISVYHDKAQMMNEIQQNDAHENWIVNLMAKNSYKFK